MGRFELNLFGVAGLMLGFSASTAFAQCELDKLTASDAGAVDRFGVSVAISGNIAIIGSAWDDDNGSDSGATYVFRRSGSNWIEEQKLLALDGAAGDFFGVHVALSGETAVIAAHWDDDNGNRSGSAYVFRYDGADWIQEAKLLPSDGAAEDQFGTAVSISGNTIAIGAYQDDNANGADAGAVYVFQYDGSNWVEEAILLASDGAAGDQFSLGLSVGADAIVVGAQGDDTAAGAHSGSAYVFRFDGNNWAEVARLTASDAVTHDLFGGDLMISGDTIVISAVRDDDNGTDSGSAYIFQEPPDGWVNTTETAKLTASDGAAFDWFAYSVAISGDTVVVGAINDDDAGSRSGAVYVFKKPAGGWVNMAESAKLTASDGAASDQLGNSVGIFGGRVVAGAFEDDDNGTNTGSVYMFAVGGDCNGNEDVDLCEISADPSLDQDANDILDECEDLDGDGVPDDEDDCPDSDLDATIVIAECDTGIENKMLDDGCTMADLIMQCADDAVNHGAFVRCVSHLANLWKCQGLINELQKGAIMSCAGQANLP